MIWAVLSAAGRASADVCRGRGNLSVSHCHGPGMPAVVNAMLQQLTKKGSSCAERMSCFAAERPLACGPQSPAVAQATIDH